MTNILRKVVIKVNDKWTQTIELSRVNGEINKRTFWNFGMNETRFDETNITISDRSFNEELKNIASKVRHYGNRVLENI